MADKQTTSDRTQTATAAGTQQGAQGREGSQARQGGQSGQQMQSGRQAQGRQGGLMQGRRGGMGRQQGGGLMRGAPSFFMNPFALLGRLTDEMTNVFDEAGAGGATDTGSIVPWVPDVDLVQRGNELVARVDLPGVNVDDLIVEIGDDAITISGVRGEEREDEQEGVYRYERRIGTFSRVIPLPEGAITDQARATFNNGVLEIAVPAPPEQVSRGRRVEITQGTQASGSQSGASRTGQSAESRTQGSETRR
jgi:HSP20 family protein